MGKQRSITACLMVLMFPVLTHAQTLKGSALTADQDRASVERTIKAQIKAISDFPRSRDVESILRFFSKDFIGTEDGKEFNLSAIRESLNNLLDSLKAGNSVVLAVEARNIEIELNGDTATAKYEVTETLTFNGRVARERRLRITDRLTRQGDGWLFEYSINSSINESPNRSSVSSQAANSAPGGVPRAQRIVDETFKLSAGQFRIFDIRLDQPGVVTGRFDISGSRLSDIKVFLIHASEYDNLRNNRPYRAWYISGQVVSDSLNVRLPPGYHLLVFSNAHSVVVGATVRAVIDVLPF